MNWNIYLSGEIHSNWRDEIIINCQKLGLPIEFTQPITNHEHSDNCGPKILGSQKSQFWDDHNSAKINAIKTKTAIEQADLIIIKFGDKYKQWNTAFEAGYSHALSKPLIVIHQEENQHALKEIDAAALAVVKTTNQLIRILNYIINEKL